jgi:hypothetical protein
LVSTVSTLTDSVVAELPHSDDDVAHDLGVVNSSACHRSSAAPADVADRPTDRPVAWRGREDVARRR